MAYRGPWDDPSAKRVLGALGEATGEPTGFFDSSLLTVTWSDSTPDRTLTLTPVGSTFTVYVNGVRYLKSTESIQITDTEGLWYIYYNSSGVLSASQTFPTSLTDNALVWVGYWDATNSKMITQTGANELHGTTMSGSVHLYLHEVFGAQYESGLALGNLTTDGDGSSQDHITFSVASGEFHDEDIEVILSDGSPQDLSPIVQIPVFYLSGATPVWRRQDASNFAIILDGVSGRAAYNKNNAGTWEQAAVTSNQFVLVHIFATNEKNHPILAIQGQNDYLTKTAASAGADTEIGVLYTVGLPLEEWVPIATLIVQTKDSYTNSQKSRYVTDIDGADYIDWRTQQLQAVGASVTNLISAGNSNVTVVDSGNGQVEFNLDGYTVGLMTVLSFHVGRDDTGGGIIGIYGKDEAIGGQLHIYNAADADSLSEYWKIQSEESNTKSRLTISAGSNDYIGCDEDTGAFEAMFGGVKEVETISGALKATNALRIAGSATNITSFKDEDDMSSNDDNAVASQQSIKAYADAVGRDDNAIINADFNIWQRGTSFAAIAHGAYSADRWLYHKVGTMVHTVSRDTDVPTQVESDHYSNYSLKIDCTTVDSSIAAADLCAIQQRIEGYNFAPFVGKTATLSFWVKATKIGTYCVAFVNSGADRSYVSEYTVNQVDTWEKKTISLDFDYSGGTWDYTNGIGIQIKWALAAGSNSHTTADTWQSGNYIATSNQVNACDNTANNFFLSKVRFEMGSVATPFEYRSIQEEIALCQRYFQKSYDFTTDPGSAVNAGRRWIEITGVANSTYDIDTDVDFAVEMRTAPTITSYSPTSGTSGKARASGTDYNASISSESTHGFHNNISVTAASTARQIQFQWAAEAEL